MKMNKMKAIVFAMAMVFTSVAFANTGVEGEDLNNTELGVSETLEVKIFSRTNGIIAVNFKKQEDETVKVKIYNKYGRKVFKDTVKSDEVISKRYDLSLLPDGIYFVEVSNENYLVRRMVTKN